MGNFILLDPELDPADQNQWGIDPDPDTQHRNKHSYASCTSKQVKLGISGNSFPTGGMYYSSPTVWGGDIKFPTNI